MVRALSVFLICALFGCSSVFAATTARFNRDTIRLNETVELIIESDQKSVSSEVDLTEVEKQFRVVSKRRDTNVTVINGSSLLVHRWRMELAPLSVGSFGVGPIVVDQEETNRLRLTVLPQAVQANVSEEVFIELEIDKDSVYVQQQILLTANLFISVRLLDGALVDPGPANTLVLRLGKDVRYEAKRGNKSYAVFQRRYALIPQQSGELVIPALQFEGLADDTGVSNNGVFSPLFSQGRRIYANGKAIKVEVKPPAAGFTGNTWLPAAEVTITEETDNNTEIEVGQPITRKIRLQGVNVTAEQLPEPDITDVPGIRSYPDQSRLTTEETETGVVGSLSIDIAMIGPHAGDITLPAISVPWWNTQTDEMETAILPARVIRVIDKALVSTGENTATAETRAAAVQPNPETVSEAASVQIAAPGIWKWLTVAMAILWFITLIFFFRFYRQREREQLGGDAHAVPVNLAVHYERIQKACGQSNPLETRNALVAWGRARFGRPVSLPEIADLIPQREGQSPDFRRELQLLDKALFSRDLEDSWKGGQMWRLFERVSADSANHGRKSPDILPRLYPAA